MVPLVWLLAGFLSSSLDNMDSTAQERQGVAFNQAVYRALEASDQWRFVARSQAYGDVGLDAAAARKDFDDRLAEVRRLSQPVMNDWSLEPLWARIDQDLAAVPGTTGTTPSGIYTAMTRLSRSVGALLPQAVDRSGLALDPELSSYYLMSAALMRGPEIIRATAELRGLAGGALRAGRIELSLIHI